jgi:hypothetical protein
MREVNQPSGGIFGRIASSGPVQKVEQAAGAGIEKVAKVGNKPTPSLASSGNGLRQQVLGRTIAPIIGKPLATSISVGKQMAGRSLDNLVPSSQPMQPQDASSPTDLSSALIQGSQPAENDIASQYPLENAIADAKRDPKNADYYMSLYKFIQDSTTSQEKPLNSTQQTQVNNATSALSDLQTLADSIQQDPSVLQKDAIPGGGLARKLTGTNNYDAAKQNIVDVIARLRSGAAITNDEAKRYMSLLPGAFDDQNTAIQKLTRLSDLLSAFANPQPASADLGTVLSQLQ